MLHLITPLYHYDLLEDVYRSIPDAGDITWHIATSKTREKLSNGFLLSDPRVRLYILDCPDSDTITKRNAVFETIHDGYFFLLDDDTVFLPALYELYRETAASGFRGMVVGDQLNYNYKNNLREASLPTSDVLTTDLDSGMILSYHSVLPFVKWEWRIDKRDSAFWSKCFIWFGAEHVKTVNVCISVYNSLALIKVDQRLLGIRLKFNITSFRIASYYVKIVRVLKRFRLVRYLLKK